MHRAPSSIELHSSVYIEELLREAEKVRPKLPRACEKQAKRSFAGFGSVWAWTQVRRGRRRATAAALRLSTTGRPVEPSSTH